MLKPDNLMLLIHGMFLSWAPADHTEAAIRTANSSFFMSMDLNVSIVRISKAKVIKQNKKSKGLEALFMNVICENELLKLVRVCLIIV